MKASILILLAVLFVRYSTLAQITRNSVLVGGDLSFYSTTQVNNGVKNKASGFTISPLAGKAIKENLVLGGFFSIGLTDNDGINNSVNSSDRTYSAGFFVRKYGVIRNNFYGFLQGNLGAGYSRQENIYINNSKDEINRTTIGAFLSPGLSYRVSKKLHLEAGLRELISLGYTRQKTAYNGPGSGNESKTSSVHFSTSLNNFNSGIYFGFRLMLAGD